MDQSESTPGVGTSGQKRSAGASILGILGWLFLGYASSLWYTGICAALVFGPWEFLEPDARERTLTIFHFLSVGYLALQLTASVVGSEARYSRKEGRLIANVGYSAIPLIVPVTAILLGVVAKSYAPAGTDVTITFFVTAYGLLDLVGFTWLEYRSVRRVDDHAKE